jgi:DNA-binding NarL/FixJ family response regulator
MPLAGAIIQGMNTIRILLADDHAIVRAGIYNALKDLPGLEIVGEVGNGPALFAALQQTQPDCLLIDVVMPNFEPLAAIQQIRASYPALKILVVSAHDDDVYVQGLLGAGVDGYHLKDQPLSDLRLAVQRVLAGERWLSHVLLDRLIGTPNLASTAPALTPRQRDLLALLQQGFDNQTIAQRMGLSIKTIENHLTRLYRQLNVQSRLEAVNYAIRHADELALAGQEACVPATPTTVLTRGQITILLVDDNARYRRQLRRMVGKISPQAAIYEAENTKEAIRLIEDVTPHLALVDVVLGDEDGIRCARQIRVLSPQSRIVLISAYPDREFHRLGLEAGAVAFLDKKDLDAAALRQVIVDMLP